MNNIDKSLWEEFGKDRPSIDIIEKYILEGANINSLNKNSETLLNDFLDEMIYKINYYDTDDNGDLIAFSNKIPDEEDENKLELLLKFGANPKYL